MSFFRPDELIFGLDDGLQKAKVLNVLPVRLDAVDKVLNHLLTHLYRSKVNSD